MRTSPLLQSLGVAWWRTIDKSEPRIAAHQQQVLDDDLHALCCLVASRLLLARTVHPPEVQNRLQGPFLSCLLMALSSALIIFQKLALYSIC